MDIDLPTGAVKLGENLHQANFSMSSAHTEADPYVILFKRRPLNGDTYGYQIKVVRSHTDASTSEKKNQIIEVNFRNWVHQNATNATEAFTSLRTALNSAGMADVVTKTSILPDGVI